MAQLTSNQQLYDLLVTKNFDLEVSDSQTGRPPVNDQGQPDNSLANEFKFDFVTQFTTSRKRYVEQYGGKFFGK